MMPGHGNLQETLPIYLTLGSATASVGVARPTNGQPPDHIRETEIDMAQGEYIFGTAIRTFTILNGARTRTHGAFETKQEAEDALSAPDVADMVGEGATVIGNSTLRQEGRRGRKSAATKAAEAAGTNGQPDSAPVEPSTLPTVSPAPTGQPKGAKVPAQTKS